VTLTIGSAANEDPTAADPLDSTREAAGRYVRLRSEYDRETTPEAGVTPGVVEREHGAEAQPVEAIPDASPGGLDLAEAHDFGHSEGGVFVARPWQRSRVSLTAIDFSTLMRCQCISPLGWIID
jgi:hypothetical protein